MKELELRDDFTSKIPYLFGRDYLANYLELIMGDFKVVEIKQK